MTTAGANALALNGATAVNGALAIWGTGGVNLSAMLTDSAGDVTLGNSAGDVTALSIASTGVFDFTDDHNLLRGTATSSAITNAGKLEKTGGTGVTNIAPAIANTGTIKTTAGTLELSGAVTGTGADKVVGAATLEFAGSVAAGQTLWFSGAGGTLELLSPNTFSATISDFDLGGATGDSLLLASPWTYASFSENSAGTLGVMTLHNGATTATLSISGNYNAANFDHTTNAAGQTVITYG